MSLTESQKAARRQGVGASELLAALGKDSRCSRLELFLRKIGDLPEPDIGDVPRVKWGSRLEATVRDAFAETIGQKVIVPHQTLFHPDAPLVGHPDGWIPALTEGVEIKCADKYEAEEFGEPGSDQVPVRYLVQCAGYMALTNADTWHLAVLIGGNDFRVYRIPRDPQIEAAVLAGVREFWPHVEQRRPPEPATPEDVKLLWPKSVGRVVIATPEIEQLCGDLAGAKLALKEAELKEGSLKAELQKFMEDAAELVDSSGTKLATWRTNKPSTKYDVKRAVADMPDLMKQYEYQQPGARPLLLK
ncbi:MAG TPA: YqaJ viral recombinase family protein [Gammaproteobacteria bacterium]